MQKDSAMWKDSALVPNPFLVSLVGTGIQAAHLVQHLRRWLPELIGVFRPKSILAVEPGLHLFTQDGF